MNAPLYRKIELAFWDFIIQTLSENEKVRLMVSRGYRKLHNAETRRYARYLAASAVAGLLSGFLLFILVSI